MVVKLSTATIRSIGTFEKITKVHAKDCIPTESCIYFLVDSQNVGLAIGKSGVVVKEVSRVLGKMVKVLPYADSMEQMVKNMIPSASSIDKKDNFVTVTVPPRDKTAAIGRNGENIKILKTILERYFNVADLKIR